jgi:hypothetical protein
MISTSPTDEDQMKPQLRLLRGGKGPPINTTGINWLRGLTKNTAFTCKRKTGADYLDLYIIAFKYEKSVILVSGLDNNLRFVVDPEDFCKKYNLFEVIGIEGGEPAVEEGGKHPEEVTDGNSEGTVPESTVVNDADAT